MNKPKNLISVSNHPVDGWSEKQRKEWDIIHYIPFPNIPASADKAEVEKIGKELCKEIGKAAKNNGGSGKIYLHIQGEFSLCFFVFLALKGEVTFVFPSSERIVREENGRKISQFKFNLWREM